MGDKHDPNARQLTAAAIPLQAPSTCWLRRGLATVRRLIKRQQERRALLKLDRHMLEDIGVTRDQAKKEARKPFWK